jgi:hypothetical protein
MLIANLAVLLIAAGCAAYQYKKGNFVKSFASLIAVISAGIVAFAYFELVANLLITRGDNDSIAPVVPWAQPLAFVLLFVVAFAILQTIIGRLTHHPADLGPVPERIGRVVCGIFTGIIAAGLLLAALAMAPLPNNYPYPRFDERRPDPEKPKKVLFNADGFAVGWFSIVSKGSLSGNRSFAVLHPDFLDQSFLNRLKAGDDISITTASNAIQIPVPRGEQKTYAVWPPPQGLKDHENRALLPKSGHNLTIVRVGIKRSAIKDAGQFALSQLRLICKPRAYARNPLTGKGKTIYPIGYLRGDDQLQIKQLSDVITLGRSDFEERATVRWIDFAFYVPNNSVPVLVELKQNSIVEIPPSAITDGPQPAVPFTMPADRKEDKKEDKAQKPEE